MSHARRRRSLPQPRLGARTAAALTALTLTAAVAVPAALAPEDGPDHRARHVRGAAAGALLAAPTDQIRAREWHLNAMRVPRAWKWSKGADVTVAVLDTGVDKRHPDLVGRVDTGPDLTGGARRPGSKYWGLHGTSMASIIAGHGHGAGQQEGVIGVAPQSRVLSIRVTWENDDPMRQNGAQVGHNRNAAVAQGIRYAVDHGAGIINMSLGGGQLLYNGNSTEESAIRYALDKGVVLIASAGNDGAGANRKNFPAAYPGVIAVGALDQKGRLWKDSNRRPYVAVCAPGVEIVSADTGSGYVVGTGTSPSSALVAGVAALIRSRYPKLTPDQVRQALVQGSPARPGQPTGTSTCAGPLDATRALTAAGRLNRTAHGKVAAPPAPAAQPTPVAHDAEQGTETLIVGIVGGGGVVVLAGLILGWRQRRRPGDEPDPFDEGRPEPAMAEAHGLASNAGTTGPAPGALDLTAPADAPGAAYGAAVETRSPAPPMSGPATGSAHGRADAQGAPYAAADETGWTGSPSAGPGHGSTPWTGLESAPGATAHGPASGLGLSGASAAGSTPWTGPADESGQADPGHGRSDGTALNGAPGTGTAYGTAGTPEPVNGTGWDGPPQPGYEPAGVNGAPEAGGSPVDQPGHGLLDQGGRGSAPGSGLEEAPGPADAIGWDGSAVNGFGRAADQSETPEDSAPFDNDDWERFRRDALGESPLAEEGSPAPAAEPPPARPLLDEFPTSAVPSSPPPGLAEDPQVQAPKRPRPVDEEDYRPPWW
ncbi:S8 family serine peptidase [Actinomadura macrotermitis]|uniref:Peptidase S8/S53 domain-containing protein n=1 Tax=Actinomadura macrotermitis TaxID=2585200 RepID=A0A7K0BTU3_9ACTN|nr:S8 family serine peptidase [Actinomadura macrotermitis]MQY04322.1 hypothetical protein [Actinomadura macrotermitis]